MNHPQLAAAFTADKPRAKWHDETLWFVRSKRDKAAWQLPESAAGSTCSRIAMHPVYRMGVYPAAAAWQACLILQRLGNPNAR